MNNNDDYALLTDLYQITMAQGYWACGKLEEEGCFHIFFREPPFKGGYAIASGMDHIAEVVENFSFSDESVEYLASIDAPGGGKLFNPDFLEYLRTLELTVEIDAVREGTVVFPNDPIVRVTGPIVQCQLLETQLLNCVNFETLAATKAARVCLAAETPVAEFGLRRAQGESGRACVLLAHASWAAVLLLQTCLLVVSTACRFLAPMHMRGLWRLTMSSRHFAHMLKNFPRTAYCS